MGTVYLAEDKENQGRCVIKQLTNRYDSAAELKEAIRLFKREAEILSKLKHPGIVRILDYYATDDGRYFLVMDLVQGCNLDTMVKTGGPFKSEHACWIGIQICEILEYLHGLKPPIIYRDLKPSNLMLTPEGRIILIDFGIARNFMPQDAATRVVSAGYSPPEQYMGKPEIRSDLYSLGATLMHILTGQKPRPLISSAPLSVISDIHPKLDLLVRQLTALHAEQRPPSARAVRIELAKIYHEFDPNFPIPQAELPAEPQSGPETSWAHQLSTQKRKALQRESFMSSMSNATADGAERNENGSTNKHGLWQNLRLWLSKFWT